TEIVVVFQQGVQQEEAEDQACEVQAAPKHLIDVVFSDKLIEFFNQQLIRFVGSRHTVNTLAELLTTNPANRFVSRYFISPAVRGHNFHEEKPAGVIIQGAKQVENKLYSQ